MDIISLIKFDMMARLIALGITLCFAFFVLKKM